MSEIGSQDFFGGGLRAYLERLSDEDPVEQPSPPGSAESSGAPGAPVEPQRPATLEERERALADRETRFAEHVQAFEAHAAGLERRERELVEREQEQARRLEERRAVREALREHAELSVARVLDVFDQALTATHPNGAPDHAARLTAVRILLGEAYATGESAEAAAAAMDELATLRERRVADSGI